MTDEPQPQPQRADADHEREDDDVIDIQREDEKQKQRVEPPPLYNIVLLNDDYTPMEWVVRVLQTYFGKTEEAAGLIMMTVHRSGKAVAGTYPKDLAESKAAMVNQVSQGEGHPFTCDVEQA